MHRAPTASPASNDPLGGVRTRRARAPRRGTRRLLTAAFAATALVSGLVGTSGMAAAAAAPAAAVTAAAVTPIVPGDVFITDTNHDRVVKIPANGSAQTTVGTDLNRPYGVAVDTVGNVFFADPANNRVVRIPADGTAQALVGTGLSFPFGVAVDAAGNVYIADTLNSRVVKVPADGTAQTLVGTDLNSPRGVAVDAAGNLFIADTNNNRVLKIHADGSPQTVVGTGLNFPGGVAVDAAGNVYITDTFNDRVVKVPADGTAQTTVGTGLNQPGGVAVDAAGNLFIADTNNNRVLKIHADGSAQSAVGTGLSQPYAVAVYAPPPTFSAATPPVAATVGSTYTYTYTAITPPGEPPATFAVASGTLPPGLSLNPTTGVLSGTPTTPGTYKFVPETRNAATGTRGPLTTITVGQLTQAITFTSTPPASAVVGATYAVTGTSSSGLPVTFTTTGACSIDTTTNTVTFTGAGACTIAADQAGNTDYAPAPQVTQAITVGQLAQAITFTATPPTAAVVGGTYLVSAAGGASGNPVTFTTTGPCSINTTNTATFTAAGTCTVTADQAGNTDYTAAPRVQQSITVRATVPGAPTNPVATAGDGEVTLAFTPPTDTGGGTITSYTVTANGGGHSTTATGTGSPITVRGLTNGTAYTLTVAATNSAGTGPASTAVTATPVAATSVNTYSINGTATPPAGSASPFGPGSLTATVGASGFTDGALTLPDITIPGYRLFGVLPTTVQAHIVPTAPVTGTITNNTLTVTSSVTLHIDQISVLGIPLLTPGSTCQTVTPSTLTLTGAAAVLQNGGTLTGRYTAANFTGCGLLGFFLEPLLNTHISSTPNTITATLVKPVINPAP